MITYGSFVYSPSRSNREPGCIRLGGSAEAGSARRTPVDVAKRDDCCWVGDRFELFWDCGLLNCLAPFFRGGSYLSSQRKVDIPRIRETYREVLPPVSHRFFPLAITGRVIPQVVSLRGGQVYRAVRVVSSRRGRGVCITGR